MTHHSFGLIIADMAPELFFVSGPKVIGLRVCGDNLGGDHVDRVADAQTVAIIVTPSPESSRRKRRRTRAAADPVATA